MTLTQLTSSTAVSLIRESLSPPSHDLNQPFYHMRMKETALQIQIETLEVDLRGAALLSSKCNLFIAFK